LFIFTQKSVGKKAEKAKFFLKRKWVFFFLSVLILIVYAKSFQNGYNIDDNYVIENHQLAQQGIKAIPEIFTSRYHTQDNLYFGYRPLTVAIYAIEWDFFVNFVGVGADNFPHVGHIINVIYYIITCCLLYYTIALLFNKTPYGNLLALISAIIFVVHPVHTEVVLSLKNREELICTILSLIATIQAIRYYDSKKIWRALLTILCLTFAFLAKESAVIFLLIIPITVIFFRSELHLNYKFDWKQKETYYNAGFWTLALLYIFSLKWFSLGGFKADNILFILPEKLNKICLFGFILSYLIFNIIASIRSKFSAIYKPDLNSAYFYFSTACIILAISISSSILAALFLFISCIFITRKTIIFQTRPDEAGIDKTSNIKSLFKNKLVVASLIVILVSGAAILSIYYAQNVSLPEKNAPVFKWQNPVFDFTKSSSEKLSIALYSFGYYSKLLLIPFPLRFYYGYRMIPDSNLSHPVVILSVIMLLALLAVALITFNKRSPLSYGILFFLITIIPFSNFVFPLTGIVAERLLFIPSIGFCVIVSYLIILLLKSHKTVPDTKKQFTRPLLLSLVVVIPFSVVSVNRNDDWKDRPTLYAHDIIYLSNSAKANNLYANYLIAEVYARIQTNTDISPVKENINLAINYYKRAVEIDSTYANPLHNLGYIYLILKEDFPLAKTYFNKCIALDTTIDEAILNRGIANYHLHLTDSCITDLDHYMKISGKMPDKAYYYLAKAYIDKNNHPIAADYFIKLLETNKTTRKINDEIKTYFFERKDYTHAILAAQNQIRFDPNSDLPYVDIGNYYLLSGDTVQAIVNWETAFENFNGNYNIGMTLSGYFAGIGNTAKAQYYYQKAIAFRQKHK